MSVEERKQQILSDVLKGDLTEDEAFERINRLNERLHSQEKRADEAVMDAVKELENTQVNGITTGFSSLDRYVLFRREELSIIGARPGVGKTATAVYMSYCQMREGKKVLPTAVSYLATQNSDKYTPLICDAKSTITVMSRRAIIQQQ